MPAQPLSPVHRRVWTAAGAAALLAGSGFAEGTGRDDSGATVQANPFYNRLLWNFTDSGLRAVTAACRDTRRHQAPVYNP